MMIGFTVFALYVDLNLSDSEIGVAVFIMQKRNRIAMEWKDWTVSTHFFALMAGCIITKLMPSPGNIYLYTLR